jgi:hypothetical protein
VDGPPPQTFPTGAFQQFSSSSKVARAGYTEQEPKRNYVMQWNFNLERQLARSLVATLGYVGSRGVHQPYRVDDFDMVLPTLTSAGLSFRRNGGEGLNPTFAGPCPLHEFRVSCAASALQKRDSRHTTARRLYQGKHVRSASCDDGFPNDDESSMV